MRTARLAKRTCFSVITRCRYWLGGGARGSDVQGGRGWWVPCPMSRGFHVWCPKGRGRNGAPGGGWVGRGDGGGLWCPGGEAGGSTVGYNAPWVMVTLEPPMNRMTDTTENITFPQFLWRAVIKQIKLVHILCKKLGRSFGLISRQLN